MDKSILTAAQELIIKLSPFHTTEIEKLVQVLRVMDVNVTLACPHGALLRTRTRVMASSGGDQHCKVGLE